MKILCKKKKSTNVPTQRKPAFSHQKEGVLNSYTNLKKFSFNFKPTNKNIDKKTHGHTDTPFKNVDPSAIRRQPSKKFPTNQNVHNLNVSMTDLCKRVNTIIQNQRILLAETSKTCSVAGYLIYIHI